MKRFWGDEEERRNILFLLRQQLHRLRVYIVGSHGLSTDPVCNLLPVEDIVLRVGLERPQSPSLEPELEPLLTGTVHNWCPDPPADAVRTAMSGLAAS